MARSSTQDRTASRRLRMPRTGRTGGRRRPRDCGSRTAAAGRDGAVRAPPASRSTASTRRPRTASRRGASPPGSSPGRSSPVTSAQPRAGRRRPSPASSRCGRSASGPCSEPRSRCSSATPRPPSAAHCSSRASWEWPRSPPWCRSRSGSSAASTTPRSRTSQTVIAGSVGLGIVVGIVLFAISLLASALLQGVIVLEAARATLGEKLTLGALWKRVWGRILPLVGWLLLLGIGFIVVFAVVVLVAVLIFAQGEGFLGLGIAYSVFAGIGLTRAVGLDLHEDPARAVRHRARARRHLRRRASIVAAGARSVLEGVRRQPAGRRDRQHHRADHHHAALPRHRVRHPPCSTRTVPATR